MSWSGTVRCSYCYLKGHNKRGCQKLTAVLLQQYTRYVTDAEACRFNGDKDGADKYDSHAEARRAQYMKRTKIDPATGEKAKNKTAKAERMKSVRCGYCQNLAHTRRSCERLKADYLVFLAESRTLRKDVMAKVREAGIGVGSMISHSVNGTKPSGAWGPITKLSYVKGYDWKDLNTHSQRLMVRVVDYRHLHSVSVHHAQQFSLQKLVMTMATTDAPQSLSGSVEPPDGWLEFRDPPTVKVAFPSSGPEWKKRRDYGYAWPSDARKEVIRSLGLEEVYRNAATQ
jgi:hypothetical protein